jgi:hypothetical protein
LLLKRYPTLSEDQPKEAHAYAHGGAIIQDLGYYPFGSKEFSDLVQMLFCSAVGRSPSYRHRLADWLWNACSTSPGPLPSGFLGNHAEEEQLVGQNYIEPPCAFLGWFQIT